MNVLEFLKEFKNDERFINSLWRDAFAIYESIENTVECTESYFRSKYNALRKELGYTTKPTTLKKPNYTVPVRPNPQTVEAITTENEVKDIPQIVVETFGEEEIQSFDPSPIPTGLYCDDIIGQDTGFARSSVNVFVGGPGAGKTSTLVALACEAIEHREREIEAMKRDYEAEGLEWDEENPPLKPITANIVHGEMRKKEWMVECHQLPYFNKVGMLFLRQYRGNANYTDILKQALSSADIIIVDSFPVILSHMKISYPRKTAGAILYEVIDLFTDTADEANNVINVINQVNKDGQYKGGTDLVHMVSSLCYIRVANNGWRYMEFEKNRNCGATINRKLFLNRNEDKRIFFNEEAYETTYLFSEDKEETMKELLDSLGKPSEIEIDFSDQTEEEEENIIETATDVAEN